jgi:hypothetical protein
MIYVLACVLWLSSLGVAFLPSSFLEVTVVPWSILISAATITYALGMVYDRLDAR